MRTRPPNVLVVTSILALCMILVAFWQLTPPTVTSGNQEILPPIADQSVERVPAAMGSDQGSSPSFPAVRLLAGLLRISGEPNVLAGRISIVNATDVGVTEFRLRAEIDHKTYELMPYEGTVADPRELKSMSIAPGEKIIVPVMISKFKTGKRTGIVPARIMLDAWLDSSSKELHDLIQTP